MSDWELEHLLAADDVTIVGLCVVFQFEVYLINLKKDLVNIKSQVAPIIHTM